MPISTATNIDIVNVSKHYLGKYGVKNVTLTFQIGKLNLLVGKNGSGKSTLIKCIMGVVRYEGTIIRQKTSIGYAPEEYVMPYFMTVRRFLESIGAIRDIESKRLISEIDEQLTYFDLKEHEHRRFGTLSNGMRQKVNLIQAFLNHPKTILLDEPLHGLDEDSQKKTLALIRNRIKESLVIVSTHYPESFKSRNRILYRMVEGVYADEQQA